MTTPMEPTRQATQHTPQAWKISVWLNDGGQQRAVLLGSAIVDNLTDARAYATQTAAAYPTVRQEYIWVEAWPGRRSHDHRGGGGWVTAPDSHCQVAVFTEAHHLGVWLDELAFLRLRGSHSPASPEGDESP